MPSPIDVETRRELVKRREGGESLKAISEDMDLSYNTAKKLWTHWRKHQKVTPNYEKAREKGTRQYAHLYEEALTMRREHPRWGAPLIRIKLSEKHPDEKIPSARTLQRWFRQANLGRSPKVRQKGSPYVKRGQGVHEVWAMDAKEQMRLADGSYASWLVVTDEGSGAILDATSFPPEVLDES